MSRNKHHRPGGSLKSSPSNHLKRQFEQVDILERQLDAVGKHDENKATQIRPNLCEVLSDIILTSPKESVDKHKDCIGRLWRRCFYTPIGIWRSRINKEIKRKGEGQSSTQSVRQLEASFSNFLQEAITLFEYLITQYKSKLMPMALSQSQSQHSSSQLTQQTTQSQADLTQDSTTSTEGVVMGLYRLFVYLGDLYRYNKSFDLAEEAYLSANKLAPGLGQPYNQLAVTCQTKDQTGSMTCIALYWYVRAILSQEYLTIASKNDIGRSSGNLQHLFKINRKMIEEHARSDKPLVLPSRDSSNPSSSTANKGNKGMSHEEQRARKSAVSKSCLTHFVRLHDLLLGETAGEENDEDHFDSMEMIEDLMESLRSLLEVTALGDGLLSKMVVINIFSVEKQALQKNAETSLDLLLEFTAVLIHQTNCVLKKNASNKKGKPTTIRLLLPALIAIEYLVQRHDEFANNLNLSSRISSHPTLWSGVATTSSIIQNEVSGAITSTSHQNYEDNGWSLKEYRDLNGFAPLSFLVSMQQQHTEADEDLYVSHTQAVSALALDQTQSQIVTSKDADSVEVQNEIKCKRFLGVLDLCARNPDIPIVKESNPNNPALSIFAYQAPVCENGDDSILHMDVSEEDNAPLHRPLATINPAVRENNPDGEQNSLVYQLPKDGVGPALLVPAALLGQNTAPQITTAVSSLPVLDPMQEERGVDQQPSPTHMSGSNLSQLPAKTLFPSTNQSAVNFVQPPPGFGVTTSQGQQTFGFEFSSPDTAASTSANNMPGIHSDGLLFPPLSLRTHPQNPFDPLSGPLALEGNMYTTNKAPEGDFVTRSDGRSALGAEFLNSLWMENGDEVRQDQARRNPFG